MKMVVTDGDRTRRFLRDVWAGTASDPVLAQTLVEKLFLSALILATFISIRGLLTRWSTAALRATDLYHLCLLIGLVALSLRDTLSPTLALVVLIYVVYETVAWTLFDLLVLLRFPTIEGESRTPVRSVIWTAYSYSVLIWSYGLYYWSSGHIVHSSGKRLSSGLTGVYFSAVTMTTVGFGDFTPMPERLGVQFLVVSEPFLGLLLLGVYLALLVSVYASAVLRSFR